MLLHSIVHAIRRHRRLLLLSALLTAPLARVIAQPPQQPGVMLRFTYRPGQKTGLLVAPIAGASGDSIATILSRDLKYSDRFSIVDASSGTEINGAPNYALYTKLGADGVVQGTLLPSGWLRIALHDVNKKAVSNQKDFPLPTPAGSPAWRMAVHGVSDGIEEWITGQRGIAQTRIAFERSGRVWTVDSDGANVIPVTPRGMSPSWVPGGRGLVYVVLDGVHNPLMYTDLSTGAQREITSAKSVESSSPAVSPDGRTVAFARTSESGTDIYAIPIEGGTPRRVTVGRGKANTQPSFSPDGQRLVFLSDRSGHQDVYISDVDGTNAEVLNAATSGDRNQRTGPDWSPNGQLVAFQSLNGNTKQIMTINLRDNSVRAVATEGRNDDPSWAPDSRHLVFTSDRSLTRQLWIVDIETGVSRQLTRGPEARLASWSTRLQLP
jgi:TolB protein